MKERFEMIWYVVSLSLIPTGLIQLINFLFVSTRNSIGFFLVCILMFVLRWLVTGRGFVIPLGISKPTNYLIGVFFFVSLLFWEIVAGSLRY